MKGLKIRGNDLIDLGYPEGRAIGIAINVVLKHHRKWSTEEVHDLLRKILAEPQAYAEHELYAPIADALTGRTLLRTALNTAQGQAVLDTRALATGNYTVRLQNDGVVLGSKQLTVKD